MDPIVTQTLTLALASERAALASAIARREEIASDLVTQDALIEHHGARVVALEASIPAEDAETP